MAPCTRVPCKNSICEQLSSLTNAGYGATTEVQHEPLYSTSQGCSIASAVCAMLPERLASTDARSR